MTKRSPEEIADLALHLSAIDKAASDPTLAHEALDRADCIAQMWDQLVMNHPFVRARPDLKAQAEVTAQAIADCYQAIGRNQPK